MSLVDSIDSVVMLYSYAGFPQRSWKFFEITPQTPPPSTAQSTNQPTVNEKTLNEKADEKVEVDTILASQSDEQLQATLRTKTNVMSGLSIALTVLSILVAFTISLITIMGLIGENCGKCIEAAEAEDGGGLAGRWWRGWAAVSTFIMLL